MTRVCRELSRRARMSDMAVCSSWTTALTRPPDRNISAASSTCAWRDRREWIDISNECFACASATGSSGTSGT